MSGYSSVWVKINNLQTDLPILREEYNEDAILPDSFIFACAIKETAGGGDVPTSTMLELSQGFGEAIFMSVQTTVDFFLYSHWRDGELVREIQYCADEGWYELDGEKEAWELRLFNEEEKQRQLSYLDLAYLAKRPDSAKKYAEAQTLAAQIESVWSAHALQQGNFYPMATASDLYGIVMQEMKLVSPYQSSL